MLNTFIEELTGELARPVVYNEEDQTVHLTRCKVSEILGVLYWAADEIAQLREDLAGSQGAVVQMTDEITDLNGRLFDAEELVATYEFDAERQDSRVDTFLGV
jgi:hypothetical protein